MVDFGSVWVNAVYPGGEDMEARVCGQEAGLPFPYAFSLGPLSSDLLLKLFGNTLTHTPRDVSSRQFQIHSVWPLGLIVTLHDLSWSETCNLPASSLWAVGFQESSSRPQPETSLPGWRSTGSLGQELQACSRLQGRLLSRDRWPWGFCREQQAKYWAPRSHREALRDDESKSISVGKAWALCLPSSLIGGMNTVSSLHYLDRQGELGGNRTCRTER